MLKARDKSPSLGGVLIRSLMTGVNKVPHASLILNSRKFMYQVQASLIFSSLGSSPKIANMNVERAFDNDFGNSVSSIVRHVVVCVPFDFDEVPMVS